MAKEKVHPKEPIPEPTNVDVKTEDTKQVETAVPEKVETVVPEQAKTEETLVADSRPELVREFAPGVTDAAAESLVARMLRTRPIKYVVARCSLCPKVVESYLDIVVEGGIRIRIEGHFTALPKP